MEVQWFSFGDVLAWVHDDATARWANQYTRRIDPEEAIANDLRAVTISVKHPAWEQATIFVECKGASRASDCTFAYRATRDIHQGWKERIEALI